VEGIENVTQHRRSRGDAVYLASVNRLNDVLIFGQKIYN
jgi:hypothetical protein